MKKLLLFVFAILVLSSFDVFSQVIKPSGTSDRTAGQLILWYDEDQSSIFRNSRIEVTNTSDTQGVWLHIEIFRSSNESFPEYDEVERCFQLDFVDFFTPTDTHLYQLNNIIRNDGEEIGFSLTDSKGFIIITPVISSDDLRAISFPHLIGTTNVTEFFRAYRVNAMGRNAVEYSTGETLPDGTVLDGVSNGFFFIQPDSLSFSFSNIGESDLVDLVYINFIDQYFDDPTLGYRASPGQVELIPFLIDDTEQRFSCPQKLISCFDDIGLGFLDESFSLTNLLNANKLLSNESICGSGISTFEFLPNPLLAVGWSQSFIRDIDATENVLGLYSFSRDFRFITGEGPIDIVQGGVDWMLADGEETIVSSPIESPCDAGDPDAIIGTEGDDVLNGTQEDDVIIGLGGNDIINGLNGNDCIDGGRGQDTISGGRGSDNIFGGPGIDIISGNRGNDNIVGNGGGDILKGNNGSDDIKGNGGNDEIDGGSGSDNIDGGGGTDNCINGETVINCES